jgi:hypothetical protein
LTVSASDQYGLPTALDDEVILGLIQLTREDDFESRTVFFSRYHLVRLLGWRNEGKSYERLDTSLRRWLGVTFYYENAWWDKAARAWVDEHFHLLEHVAMYDRERRLQRTGLTEPPLSAFTWNDVVFRSFQAGYLKRIDMGLFRSLGSSITKRLYRLLDKRFYHKTTWEFDLRKLACEHVGLSRKYDIGQLKRRLSPAILELEQLGYLAPAPPEERFVRVDAGLWQVRFRKAVRKPKAAADRPAVNKLKGELVARGVNPVTAGRLISEYPPSEIARRIRVLDWLLRQKSRPAPRNPAGYLVQSIREGYDLPAAFGTGGRGVSRPRGIDSAAGRRQARAANTEARVAKYLKTLSPERRQSLEQAALATADRNVAQCDGTQIKLATYVQLEQAIGSQQREEATPGG